MVRKIADNIISPIGHDSAANYRAVLAGDTRLSHRHGVFGLPEDFHGSLFDRPAIEQLFAAEIGDGNAYTFFEKLCILTASRAIAASGIDPAAADVLFVLSSTKGNVDQLTGDLDSESAYIGGSAARIAAHFGNPNEVVTASNACISGVCAQIAAVRLLLVGAYRHAVVIGADVLSKFIVSGFQSFKALSPEACRPYDKDRVGLNLGEAAGCMVLTADDSMAPEADWTFRACSIHNDANHISGPSRTGEGSYRVLADILGTVAAHELAFVNAHGTATAYNDEMESIAIHRATLDTVPVNGLKGFYGHTLGAAGVIETILAMQAIDNGVVLPTRGYSQQGTTYSLDIADHVRTTSKRTFIKILSGFGGSNAGIAYTKGGQA